MSFVICNYSQVEKKQPLKIETFDFDTISFDIEFFLKWAHAQSSIQHQLIDNLSIFKKPLSHFKCQFLSANDFFLDGFDKMRSKKFA